MKKLILFCLLNLIGLSMMQAALLGPSESDMKDWLNGQTVVVKKGWIWNTKEVIKSCNVKSIQCDKDDDQGLPHPLKPNVGTAWCHLAYLYNGNEIHFEAVFTYEWSMGLKGKSRSIKSVLIKRVD